MGKLQKFVEIKSVSFFLDHPTDVELFKMYTSNLGREFTSPNRDFIPLNYRFLLSETGKMMCSALSVLPHNFDSMEVMMKAIYCVKETVGCNINIKIITLTRDMPTPLY